MQLQNGYDHIPKGSFLYVYFITEKVIISDIYGIKEQGDLLNTPEFLN